MKRKEKKKESKDKNNFCMATNYNRTSDEFFLYVKLFVHLLFTVTIFGHHF